MGTRCNIVLPGMDEDDADVIFRHIRNEIARAEGKLSRFLGSSDISIINSKAASAPAGADQEVYQILSSCAYYHEITGGCFDITLRPVLQYWKENPNGDRQSAGEILSHLGTDKIKFDENNSTVSFLNDSIEIDLGGFGKGYALEKVNEMLLRFGVKSAFLTMGESSVLTLGNHPAGDHWKVGIKNYLNPDEAIHTFNMRFGSVSTSSNFYVDDGGTLVNHRHVIDPFTGVPVEKLVAVSVFSNTALLAEVLSTAVLVMQEEKIQDVVNRFPGTCVLKMDYSTGEIIKKVWDSEKEHAHRV
ncbi:MAG: FAD:protein FMN transferase [Balneolaceae bacterium]|nr:MAG: FAD:protein FMN transferase [Balneolaceae bacterium]